MPVLSCSLRLGLVCCHFEEFAFCGQGPNVMDLSSEMNRHGKNPVSHKLEDQKKIYTDWANHYLAKSGHKRLIKDLQQDIADGVLLADIIQIIANEKVEDINGCPRSQSQMIENVDVCLSFLAARGVNVQGLSAEEIRNGNLKAILGLFFSLSRYKQQQHHQQQYYQSLVELQQRVTHAAPQSEASQAKTQQDMQSSLTARYAAQSKHSGIATSQKKPTRLPGPSRVPAASSSNKAQGASNLNRRSQSFNSIDKSKPPNYANGNEKDSSKGPQPSSGINGNTQPPSTSGQPPASAIPSPNASKPWRSKSMNVKHSATSTMLTVKQPSPATSPTPSSDRLKPPVTEGVKSAPSGQKSMLEKFKLVNARTALRPPQATSSGPNDSGKDDDAFSESGEMEGFNSGLNSGGSTNSSPKVSPKLTPPKAGSKNFSNKKSLLQPKEKEEKNRDKNKACAEKPGKEEKDQMMDATPKKTSKIASLIPKGSKTAAAKKDSLIPSSSSGIPKPGSKVPTPKQTISPGSAASKESEKFRTSKGSSSQAFQKAITMEKTSTPSLSAPLEGREASQASPSSSCVLQVAHSSGQSPGNGAVHLPQQQQHSHPNTATVAPFIYRAHSENEGTLLPPADSCTSPTKMDSSYSKTAKQCLEELSGEDPEARRMRTVKNIADLRQNLEETMSSLRGTQISHSTLETTFDTTVTTEVNGRAIPNLTSRPTPMTWRLGQACPRLQAGDAPSMGAGYSRSGTSRFIHTDPSRFMYTTPLRRAAVSRLGNMSQIDMSEKASSDLDVSSEVDVGGYMSDGDILGKSLRADDINSGYMTDGGLNLYTRSLNRVPDTATSRDVIQRGVHDVTVDADSWDDSSSVSSGLSDTLDNISTDDLNTTSSISSYSNITVPSRKNTQLKTDTEKRSTTDETWDSPEELKKTEEDLDSHVDGGAKWKGVASGLAEDSEKTGQKASLSVAQTGSWRRGMSAQGGTPARQKTSTSALKTPGKTDDAKASEKGKTPLKGSSLQRSPSDAGKSSGDEGKKPPSGIGRSTASSSFGYKKPSGVGASTMITSSGATITSGSATLGKIPKSAAIGGKSNAGRKTSLDGSQNQEDVMHVSSKATLQYRSLPRPSKSGTSGIPGRGGHRSSTSSIDSNVSSKSAGATTSKLREPTKIGSGRSSPVTVNQTDKEKEKVAVSDSDSVSLSGSPKSSPTSASACGTQGLRQPGSKYPDIASPTFRRLFGAKAGGKSASAPNTEGVKSSSVVPSPSTSLARQGSLESPSSGTGSMGSAGGLSGSSSPLFNKPSDLTTDVISLSHSLASSPASVHSFTSGGLVWAANLSSSSAGSKDTPSYQSMTSLHTSSESIDLPLSHHGSLSGLTTGTHEVQSLLMRTGSVRSTLSESMQLDRNTLPKKGLRYTPSSRQANQEEGKEWLRSHSTGGLQDTGSQSPLVSPSAMSSSATGKYHFSNLVSPTNLSQFNLPGPSMMRSNSIPAQDSSFDLYDDAQLCGSATSLEERPRAISHSGSFRDSMEEVHGSSLSLVSSTSSLYSTAEEKAHSEQIHKLRRELVASQEKVATLTSQLSANAHLVAAFEKSLGNMTGRLQSLTMTAEQKESELIELRETIEMLKAQNSAAQAAIQGALNGPDHPPKDLRIRRQHSSESVSSINSATSHSSIGSGNDADSKKKKKKNWVNSRGSELRSSFKQAFGKKKSTKPPSSHSDIEELTDSSLPASPKLPHNAGESGSSSMKPSQSASAICECTEAEAEIILQLKSELREKELKLTDIRLEALSSAHHLDQIREAMNRMQNEIEILKAENDRLKAETGNTAKPARPPSESSSTASSSSSRQSLGLSLNNLNITESVTSDILLDDTGDATGHKDGRPVKIIVSISKGYGRAKDQKSQAYLIGSIGVSGKTKWDVLDGVIRRLFKEYVFRIDTSSSLGLSSDCIASYCVGDLIRSHNLEVPELLPCGYLVGDNNIITVNLKGVEENSLDSFVFDTLIPKPITQRYFNLLMEHHRIILSGPSGTGKTYLANKLAEYVITKSGRKKTEDAIATFNVDHKSSKELQQYLANLAEQCSADNNGVELPVVIILDNLHHVGSLSDIFNGFLNCKYNKCPYIIGTMNQGVSSSPNLELHHNFRWVLCANHMEPVKGFLGRYLRRKLIEMEIERNIRNNDLVKIIDWIPKTWHHLNSVLETHSSSDVTIGPRLFLPCPMDVEGSRVWFMDLWNYSLVPYVLEAVREGLQMYGKRAPWEDPSKWVLDTYPWSSASLPQEGPALLQLRPEDVGYEGCTSTKEATTSKHIPQTDTEGDPLMNMLMKLQEAANYPGTQSCDSDSVSHHEDILDTSIESTL
ncbi:neuron navigator 3 isoform X5 [Rattus norvegicus]|uniref:Neuron navigator 3 n=1 Tax=Rattus norvegicus TaxID=10116 RepID=A0A8I5ZNK3_RAT|nr:neuron navigator 3 isoform X5 [Rattus norvegicus]XP_038935043.1 neuron navigator 3 isoform X5 [Rattus norvegicus]